MSKPDSRELLRRYEAGDTDAATAIFDRYLERLIALARSRIGPKLKSRVDAEDVVQSAYRSFFVHARNHEYQLTRAGDLWRLLAGTTVNKLYGQLEKHTAAKRSIDRECANGVPVSTLATLEPRIVDVIAIGEQLNLILQSLSTTERSVLTLTMQGQSVTEIAESLQKSERTVRRLLGQARKQFEYHLLASCAAERAKPILTSNDQAPLLYSDYMLKELLGAGGMGKVYRAVERQTGKQVAFKTLHKSRQSDARAVTQLIKEARALTNLNHPNIVGVHGLGQFPGGGLFLVMDFVEGEDLQKRLRKGPLSPKDAVQTIKQIADALQHAHSQAIVHCDLKPSNVLLDESGSVVVTDFGFAHIVSIESQPEAVVGGTEGYIAPEIYHSKPTPAADIFAIGVLLWVLLEGELPTDATVHGVADDEHLGLAAVCRRCFALDPKERFRTAAEVIAAIDAISWD